jgi:flagellar basal body rod protein FlgB
MDPIKSIDAGVLAPALTSGSAEGKGNSFALVLAGLTAPEAGAAASAGQGRLPLTPSSAATNAILGTALPSAQGSFHERALALRAYRQELLASNIANADTPGYKAVDINVDATLRAGGGLDSGVALQYAVPTQASVDGNTVEMDTERAKFAQNALMYEYEIDRVKGQFKDLTDLFNNTPY